MTALPLLIALCACGEDPAGFGKIGVAGFAPVAPAPELELDSWTDPVDTEIVGRVFDGDGNPLWGIRVAVDEDHGGAGFSANGDDYDTTDPEGAYRVHVDEPGDYAIVLHADDRYAGADPLARLDVDSTALRSYDVAVSVDAVVHCRLADSWGEPLPISSYGRWVLGAGFGFGMGGACITSHGSCGPAGLHFIWPARAGRVEVRLGEAEPMVLYDPSMSCEAFEP